jgi:hypothetical protein
MQRASQAAACPVTWKPQDFAGSGLERLPDAPDVLGEPHEVEEAVHERAVAAAAAVHIVTRAVDRVQLVVAALAAQHVAGSSPSTDVVVARAAERTVRAGAAA